MSEQNNTVELVKKITAALGRDAAVEQCKKTGKPAVVFHILGRAHDAVGGSTDKGEYVKFKGEFEAHMENGKRYKSGLLIVPSVLEQYIAGALAGTTGDKIDFAYTILVKPDSKALLGYVWGVQPLLEPKVSDEMEALRMLLPANLKMIGAPTVETKKEEKTSNGKTKAA